MRPTASEWYRQDLNGSLTTRLPGRVAHRAAFHSKASITEGVEVSYCCVPECHKASSLRQSWCVSPQFWRAELVWLGSLLGTTRLSSVPRGCRTGAPTSLLAVSWGHFQLPEASRIPRHVAPISRASRGDHPTPAPSHASNLFHLEEPVLFWAHLSGSGRPRFQEEPQKATYSQDAHSLHAQAVPETQRRG